MAIIAGTIINKSNAKSSQIPKFCTLHALPQSRSCLAPATHMPAVMHVDPPMELDAVMGVRGMEIVTACAIGRTARLVGMDLSRIAA
jgi:hypothetical protein